MRTEANNFTDSFLAGILENSEDCIKILDLDGKLLYMNQGGQRIMEIDDVSSCLNNYWIDFWNDSGRESAKECIEKAKKGLTGKFSDFCPTAKGTPKWWHVTVSAVYDERRAVKYILVSSHDITEHVGLAGKLQRMVLTQNYEISYKTLFEKNSTLEDELGDKNKSLELLNQVMEISNDITVVFDRGLNYVLANKAACERLKVGPEDLIGKSILDVYPAITSSQLHRSLLRALAGETILNDITSLNGVDYFSSNYQPLVIDGQVAGVLVKSVKIKNKPGQGIESGMN